MEQNNVFKNLKSDYFLEMLFSYTPKKKALEILKNNKNIQKRINISIDDYKNYCEQFSSIEIELVPIQKAIQISLILLMQEMINIFIYILTIIKKKKLKELKELHYMKLVLKKLLS